MTQYGEGRKSPAPHTTGNYEIFIQTETYFSECDGNAGQIDGLHHEHIAATGVKKRAVTAEWVRNHLGRRSLRSFWQVKSAWAARSPKPQMRLRRYSTAPSPHQLIRCREKHLARHIDAGTAWRRPHGYCGSRQFRKRF